MSIFRDFAYGVACPEDFEISMEITEYNHMEFFIQGYYADPFFVWMSVKYAPNLNLYDTICHVLDKISCEIYYSYDNRPQTAHKDWIVRGVDIDDKPFTRENMKYLSIKKYDKSFHETLQLHGEVSADGVFSYDELKNYITKCNIEWED